MNTNAIITGMGLRLLAVAVLTIAPALVQADEIKYGGVNYPSVRILGMRDGNILFQTVAGVEKQVPLELVEALRVEAYPELAKADAAWEQKDFAEAAKQLQAIINRVQEDYLKVLVRAKLTIALDRLGKFTDAVTQYALLIRDTQSDFAKAAMPRNLPEDPKLRAEAAQIVQAEIDATRNLQIRGALEPLLATLKAAPGESPAGDEAMKAAPGPALLVGEAEVVRDPIEEALKNNKPEEAMKMLDEDLQNPRLELSKLLYQRGRAQAALGKNMEAALSFMRVAIHFPLSENALPSLVEAGKAFQKLNQPENARQAWEEAKAKASGDEARVKEIEALLQSLNG